MSCLKIQTLTRREQSYVVSCGQQAAAGPGGDGSQTLFRQLSSATRYGITTWHRHPPSLRQSPGESWSILNFAAVLRKSRAMRCIAGVILFVFNLVQVIPADEESCKNEFVPDEEVNCLLSFKNYSQQIKDTIKLFKNENTESWYNYTTTWV